MLLTGACTFIWLDIKFECLQRQLGASDQKCSLQATDMLYTAAYKEPLSKTGIVKPLIFKIFQVGGRTTCEILALQAETAVLLLGVTGNSKIVGASSLAYSIFQGPERYFLKGMWF